MADIVATLFTNAPTETVAASTEFIPKSRRYDCLEADHLVVTRQSITTLRCTTATIDTLTVETFAVKEITPLDDGHAVHFIGHVRLEGELHIRGSDDHIYNVFVNLDDEIVDYELIADEDLADRNDADY